MKLKYASEIAQHLKFVLAPSCERLEICGSVRRANKDDVKDIELVALPKMKVGGTRLEFGRPPMLFRNLLEQYLHDLLQTGIRVNSGVWKFVHDDKDGEKMKTFIVTTDFGSIKLDLFIVTPPAQFGVIQIIRTGPAEFSKRLVTAQPHGLLPRGFKFKDGALRADTAGILKTLDERDVFDALGIPFIEPGDRQ